jgi:uncharacterized protein YeaO (DUF488 family)
LYDNSNNTTISYGSNYPSLILSGRQSHQQQSFNEFNDRYTALILEEAEKLYNELTTELTDRIIAATAGDIQEHHYRNQLIIATTN